MVHDVETTVNSITFSRQLAKREKKKSKRKKIKTNARNTNTTTAEKDAARSHTTVASASLFSFICVSLFGEKACTNRKRERHTVIVVCILNTIATMNE
jgi:uncharacterized membrane protein